MVVLKSTATLAAIILLGWSLRLLFSLHEGYGFDVGTNQGWALSAVTYGIAQSYRQQVVGTMIPNYPPFSLMVFEAAGYLYKFLSPALELKTILFHIIIKIPAMVADLLVVVLLFRIVRFLRGEQQALWAALLAALHPVLWFDSAVWGQTDILFTGAALLALVTLALEWPLMGGAFAALALLTKFQAIMFIPLVGLLALQRWSFLLRAMCGSIVVCALVFLPFVAAGTWEDIVRTWTSSVGFSAEISFNAYNFWWSLLADAAGGKDTTLLFGLTSYRSVGITIVGMFYVLILGLFWYVLCRCSRRAERLEITLACAATCVFAFFLFSTEMHERYLFPFVVLGLPLPFLRKKYLVPYSGASLALFANLLGVLPLTSLDRLLFATFPSFDVVIAVVQVVLFFLFLKNYIDHSVMLLHSFPQRSPNRKSVAKNPRRTAVVRWMMRKKWWRTGNGFVA